MEQKFSGITILELTNCDIVTLIRCRSPHELNRNNIINTQDILYKDFIRL